MGLETSHGQCLCQYVLCASERFETTVLGNTKTELLMKLAEKLFPTTVLDWFGKDGLHKNRGYSLSLMSSNLS